MGNVSKRQQSNQRAKNCPSNILLPIGLTRYLYIPTVGLLCYGKFCILAYNSRGYFIFPQRTRINLVIIDRRVCPLCCLVKT